MYNTTQSDFRYLHKSLTITQEGKEWVYPVRQDYINHLIARGHIENESDMINQPDLIIAIQRHWHGLGQTGCKFAQILSKDPQKYGWHMEVVNGTSKNGVSSSILNQIERVVCSAIHDRQIEMISLVFPEVTTPEALVSLLYSLEQLPDWSITTIKGLEQVSSSDSTVYISLRVILNNKGVLSWVLGFGPFHFLAITRLSPFTELAIRVKPYKPDMPFRELNNDPMTAHLADVPISVGSETFEQLWINTKLASGRIRANSDPLKAKAKVTFPIPASMWLK